MKAKTEILNIETFNNYLKLKSTSIKDNVGFYIQENNKFIVSIDSKLYNKFKQSLTNRKADIIAENTKIINKEENRKRNYFLIDTTFSSRRKSIKALFIKYGLIARKKRVLNMDYRTTWGHNEKQSRNQA